MFQYKNLANAVEFQVLKDAVAAGTGDTITSNAVDTTNCDGVLLLIKLGAISAGAVTTVKARQGQLANMSDGADLAGTKQLPADTDDNKLVVIDIYRPQEQYVDVQVVRATANVAIDSIIAIKYHGRKYPMAQGATVFGIEIFNSPDEGTA